MGSAGLGTTAPGAPIGRGPTMPITFPTLDENTGELREVTYYYMHEAAALLHVRRATLSANLRDGTWPSLNIGSHYYMSAAHVARVVEIESHDPDDMPPPPKLGTVVDDDDDIAGVR